MRLLSPESFTLENEDVGFGDVTAEEALEYVEMSEFMRRSMVMLLWTLAALARGLRDALLGSARGPVRWDGMGTVRIGVAVEERREVNVDEILGKGLAGGEVVIVGGWNENSSS